MIDFAQKIIKNRMYGKFGVKMEPPVELFIRKAYHGEWAIDIPWKNWAEIIIWCRETLGECGHDRRYRWRQNYRADMSRVFLRNESDVTLFRLRWL